MPFRPRAFACVVLVLAYVLSCSHSSQRRWEVERVLAETRYPFPWPDLVPPAAHQGGGEHDAAVVVAVEHTATGVTVPGALATGRAWVEHLVETRGIAARNVAFLADELATPRNVKRQMIDALAKVDPDGTLWFVYIGRARPDAFVLEPGAERDEAGYHGISPLSYMDFIGAGGIHRRTVYVIDACVSGSGTGLVGSSTADGWHEVAVPTGGEDKLDPPPDLAQLESEVGRLVADEIRGVPKKARFETHRDRVGKASFTLFLAGTEHRCMRRLPTRYQPALSYLVLASLRGWGDENRDGIVTARETLGFVRRLYAIVPARLRDDAEPLLFGSEAIVPLAINVHEAGPDFQGLAKVWLSRLHRFARTGRARPAVDRGDMVEIPGSSFLRGCNADVDRSCEGDEKPYRWIWVSGFAIDRHEVTNREYADCVARRGCTSIDPQTCYVWGRTGFERGRPLAPDMSSADHPVVCVSWHQAKSYCAFRGKRLPTEAEWELAARGRDGRIYPWGNGEPSCDRAVMHGCGKTTAKVGSRPAGKSPHGVLDMAGNVWEWTADWWNERGYTPVSVNPSGPKYGRVKAVRGGSFYDSAPMLRTSYRYGFRPDNQIGFIGFRCAK